MTRSDPDPIDVLLEAGRYLEAGEALSRRGDYEQAALWYLCELPQQLTSVKELDKRALLAARLAADCFEKAGHLERAVILWSGLDERQRAASLLELADRSEDATRARQGKQVEGSPWPPGSVASRFELGSSFVLVGDTGLHQLDLARDLESEGQLAEALAALMNVHEGSEAYAACVAMATRLVWDHELATSVEFDLFVEPFLHRAAREGSQEDAGVLYGLGRLYERLDVRRAARRAYRGTLDLAPGFLDAADRMAALAEAEAQARTWRQRQRSGEVSSLILESGVTSLAPTRPQDLVKTITPSTGSSGPGGLRSHDQTEEVAEAATPSTGSSGQGGLQPHDRTEEVAEAVTRRSMMLGLATVGPGSVVANRFVLDKPIGEGGYSVVFEGLDVQETRPVAVKLFRQNRRDPGGLARFKAEMQITRLLHHPNIVRTYDAGAWRSVHFIAMELLQGFDLAVWLEALGGRAPVPEAVALLSQALEGVGAAHDKGVVHRDLKPTNLFQTDAAVLKVMDFGLATAADVDGNYTTTGKVVGTPAYIAPERMRKAFGPVGPRSDVYSLGVVFYQMLTGELPFQTDSVAELFRLILDGTPEPPSHHRPVLPEAVDRLVLKMLARRQEARFPDCRAVIRAIDSLPSLR